jgi:predicted naringenin-chalcone synthase
MSFAILGIGTAVPAFAISQTDGAQVAKALCCKTEEHATWLPTMFSRTGIEKRHLAFDAQVLIDIMEGTQVSQSVFLPTGAVDDDGPTTGQRIKHYVEQATPLALAAAREALDRSGLTPNAITHLITISCTGFAAPGVDYALITGLGLPPTTQRTNIGFMGCHAALNGLRVASAFTTADPDARVLMCAVELCALHYQYRWEPQRVVANAIFADGAAAVVGAPPEAAPAGAWQAVAAGSCLLPDSRSAMSWTIGDNGFEMTLSKQVPSLLAKYLRPWVEKWLGQNGLKIGDVGSWAIHPGGPRILDAAEDSLGLPKAASWAAREVFASYGNMSSPTVLFILDRLRAAQAPRPCVAMGFGPGLAAEAVLFR